MEPAPQPPTSNSYTVVARRYRPKAFGELIGQDHIAHALETAIRSQRVGHAYLFTGARGVGKTSTARIFAKALNVPPAMETEVATEVSQAIDAGEDMDVIEIDGASNRGIEEIRQLRANIHVRPSRAPYKIYIIDEVHMLTNQAFNALLKTLEEPPGHVKFIFCTTDPDKIPITVLSRCQRFDFVPVRLDAIQRRLEEIAIAEGFDVDAEALALLARRANGSMRDSQSLLEQVMSFSAEKITVEHVQALLGIADEGRLSALTETLVEHDALAALKLIEQAAREGADPGQLCEQLLNYIRDLMAVAIGGGPDLLKLANPAGHADLKEVAQRWGIASILAAIQILDESMVRMRSSVSATTLLEVALVQICQLENLTSIPALLNSLLAGGTTHRPTTSIVEKKNGSQRPLVEQAAVSEPQPVQQGGEHDVAPPSPPPVSRFSQTAAPQGELPTTANSSSPSALQQWRTTISSIDDMLADFASMAVAIAPAGSDRWEVVFPPGAVKPREYCEQAERKAVLQRALAQLLGRTIQLTFSVQPGAAPQTVVANSQATSRAQKMRELAEHPLVKKVCQAIDGEILRVDSPQSPASGGSPHTTNQSRSPQS